MQRDEASPSSGAKKAATRKDVAELAGVSVATVSYVLNNDPKPISESTRERVLAAARKLSYKPNIAARSLKTGIREQIGMILPDLELPAIAQFTGQAQKQIDQTGYSLLLLLLDDKGGNHSEDLAERIEAKGLDGLIVFPFFPIGDHIMHALAVSNLPVVCVGPGGDIPAGDTVQPDMCRAGEVAAEYLYSQGCADVWLIAAWGSIIHPDRLVEGCHHIFGDKGNPAPSFKKFIFPRISKEVLVSRIENELKVNGRPDGFLFGSSREAEILQQISRKQGWNVPARRCVNLLPTEIESFGGDLPRIRYDWPGMGGTAVDLLFQRMKDRHRERQQVVFDIELVIR